jgi:hydroxyethylthiazole kinase-like uncharacterized protein yjeF
MLKVLTAAQIREVDRLTTERYGIPSILLMENAAHAVARVITEKLGGSVKGKKILVLCGPGNNGGDGAALARILWTAGAKVTVLTNGVLADLKGDARTNFDALQRLKGHIAIISVESKDRFIEHWQFLRSSSRLDAIVDAVFGTGLSRALDDSYRSFLDVARDYTLDIERVPVVAVDIPSGLNSDGDEPRECPLKATVTVTFTAPKPATVLPPTAADCGELVISHIGSPAELISASTSQLFLAQEQDCVDWLWNSRFSDASYKNKRGHALIIGGSRDYSGAAVLAGNAGIRSGVGLVTLAVPEDSRDGVIGRVMPEVMVRGVSQTPDGSAAEKAADEIHEFLKNVDAVAVGSGLSSKEDETKQFVRRIVEERQTPVVIDADGLTALSPWATSGPAVGDDSGGAGESSAFQSLPLILTPHEGEFKKLLGLEGDEAKEILRDRVQAVRDFATKYNVILVLKGERNLIGAPDGRVVVNPTGNSGLGKAGNGDTLTGILVGFVAQAVQMKIDMFETVVAAVYIAGMAGDIAEQKYGKRVMTASDVRDCLVDVFEELTKDQQQDR